MGGVPGTTAPAGRGGGLVVRVNPPADPRTTQAQAGVLSSLICAFPSAGGRCFRGTKTTGSMTTEHETLGEHSSGQVVRP